MTSRTQEGLTGLKVMLGHQEGGRERGTCYIQEAAGAVLVQHQSLPRNKGSNSNTRKNQ